MSIFRKPLGAYTRTTPDWFTGSLCAGFGFDQSGTPGVRPAVGLFNDDSQGRSLFVYGIGGFVHNASEICNVSLFNGQLTALYGDGGAGPVDTSIGALPGKVYRGLTAAQVASPAGTNQQGLYLLGSDFGSSSYPMTPLLSEHPLAIIRPGFSLAGWTFTTGLGVWFQYVVMPY